MYKSSFSYLCSFTIIIFFCSGLQNNIGSRPPDFDPRLAVHVLGTYDTSKRNLRTAKYQTKSGTKINWTWNPTWILSSPVFNFVYIFRATQHFANTSFIYIFKKKN